MTNNEFIYDFVNGQNYLPRECGHLKASEIRLFSYFTQIAQRCYNLDGANYFVLNLTRYSTTTSRHQNAVKKCLDGAKIPYFVVTNIPRGEREICDYCTMLEYDKFSDFLNSIKY